MHEVDRIARILAMLGGRGAGQKLGEAEAKMPARNP